MGSAFSLWIMWFLSGSGRLLRACHTAQTGPRDNHKIFMENKSVFQRIYEKVSIMSLLSYITWGNVIYLVFYVNPILRLLSSV